MTDCSKVKVLSMLGAYSQIHHEAMKSQKSCIWQITKARHIKGRRGGSALVDGVMLGEDVREELRATNVLKELYNNNTISGKCSSSIDEPELQDESGSSILQNNDKTTFEKEEIMTVFELTNAVEYQKELLKGQNDKTNNSNRNSSDDNNNTSFGMRRRKGGTNATSNDKENKENNDSNETKTITEKTEWTVVDNSTDQEEQRLRRADPIDLFGAMPPQELRQAQKEAQKALAFYIEAANLVISIQKKINLQQEVKK